MGEENISALGIKLAMFVCFKWFTSHFSFHSASLKISVAAFKLMTIEGTLVCFCSSKIIIAWKCGPRFPISNGGLPLSSTGQTCVELPPRVQRLTRPDPESRSDPYNESHEVLDHEDGEVGGHVRSGMHGAWDGQALTVCTDPALLPVLPEGLLVKKASNDDGGWDGVENRKHTYADHQALQLLGLGSVVLHDGADTKQGHEAGEQEWGANEEVWREGPTRSPSRDPDCSGPQNRHHLTRLHRFAPWPGC